MTYQAMRDKFEREYALINPDDKCTLLPNGNYSGWVNRGFSFGIGLSVALIVVVLVIKLVSGEE